MNGGESMKTRIEKRGAGRKQPESENVVQEEFDVKALLAALPKSDPTPYLIPGEELLKLGPFEHVPGLFKEWEEEDRKIKELYRKLGSE